MRDKWHYLALLGIFILVFAMRAFIASQTEQFSDDASYYTLSQVENIRNTGRILHDDKAFLPFFYYLLAGVYFFLPKILALKIFLNLAASTLVIAAYLIADEVTQSRKVALLSALFAGFIPVYFQQTVHSLAVLAVSLPLTFFSIYYLILFNKGKKVFFIFTKREEKYAYHFLFFIFLLILVSPSAILLIIGYMLFLFLSKIENIKVEKSNVELLLVSLFFYFWFNFLFFKRAILFLGPQIIRQNLPAEFLDRYFSQTTIYGAVYLIGIIPFLLGIYTCYIYIVRQKNLIAYILVGFSLSVFLFLWFKLVPLLFALIFLGGSLVLLLALYFKMFFDYIEKTKISRYSTYFLSGVLIILAITSIIPSITLAFGAQTQVPSEEKIGAYLWLRENTERDAQILAFYNEGNALAYLSGRRSFVDDNFIFEKNPDQIVYDVKRVYMTKFSQEAVEIMQKYSIDYIIVDEKIRKEYSIDDLAYRKDPCFTKIYDENEIIIYKLTCIGEQIGV